MAAAAPVRMCGSQELLGGPVVVVRAMPPNAPELRDGEWPCFEDAPDELMLTPCDFGLTPPAATVIMQQLLESSDAPSFGAAAAAAAAGGGDEGAATPCMAVDSEASVTELFDLFTESDGAAAAPHGTEAAPRPIVGGGSDTSMAEFYFADGEAATTTRMSPAAAAAAPRPDAALLRAPGRPGPLLRSELSRATARGSRASNSRRGARARG
jgi:hypothetical protein